MFYSALDVQQMNCLLSAKLLEMIQAKKDIQNSVLPRVTTAESWSLAMNTVPKTLIDKVMDVGKEYLNKTAKKDADYLCIAMAVGTILKELDNGNTTYVSYSGLASLMNELQK